MGKKNKKKLFSLPCKVVDPIGQGIFLKVSFWFSLCNYTLSTAEILGYTTEWKNVCLEGISKEVFVTYFKVQFQHYLNSV
jgi:hypothetical protein